MNTMHVRTGDNVIVISGKEKGKKGKILEAHPAKGMVVIEGVNIVSRHQKPRKQGEEGGIIKKEGGVRACKVMRICPKCGKPTRYAHMLMEDGSKVRQCKQCGEEI